MSCPTCHAKVVKDPAVPSKRLPFCSERCQLIDLGRWFGEDYRIAGPPATTSDGAPPPVGDDRDE
jgi:endogenous inhibitor of DNA gyrase (YacG/DUF329 family)